MVKTAYSVVNATDAMVFKVYTMVFFPLTMVFANEKIFLIAETRVLVNKKVASGFDTLVFVFHTKVADTVAMVNASNAMVNGVY
jgi:hypothetical protein